MLLFLSGCAPVETPLVELAVPAAWVDTVTDHVASLPHAVAVSEGTTPLRSLGTSQVEAVLELDTGRCGECFVVDQSGESFTIRAGGIAGALYGIAQLMEWHGWRFAHPFDTCVPATPTLSADARLGTDFSPEMGRRGYHPHTLHPIEAMYDVWGDPDPTRAKSMLDWVVRNRGNYVQWPGLDNIVVDTNTRETWREATSTVIEAAHDRGMTVGVGVQLFGQSNLQLAYDLLDSSDTEAEDEASMLERWSILTDGVPWDEVSLSFGEFFSADPETFIGRVTMAYDTLQDVAPGTAMNAVIHVGGNEDVQVEYDGQTMTYYFLVQYVDRPIEPFVHTVMYYNLEEDAGGAYGLDNFDEHRAFLEAKLAAGETVTYFPESAYWVAFDDSVPVYLPLYIRSRWLDMHTLREAGLPLDRHVLFASGWEWGYWQNDAATLRMGYSLPGSWEDAVADLFVDGNTTDAVVAAVNAQRPLIDDRLAPYLAGRDVAMDLGDRAGIYSQPRRVLFDEVADLDLAARSSLRAQVVDGLRTMADAHDAALAGLGDDRWADEVRDGLSVNAARARFMAALYDAVLLAAEGGDPVAALAEAELQLETGTGVIARRHSALHDLEFERLITDNANPTLYDYGYLTNADTLCFWRRERGQARALLLGEAWSDPGCTL
ncbi:hypothetical protein LBMAG42_40980 [Deltaproteobacteria bacterium]|nr:hypothetical protein LBMAG42_40980 [Deltaproteobacteria bacterium]